MMKEKNNQPTAQRTGKLVRYANRSTFFINYPVSKISGEDIFPEEIDEIVDQRINHTRRSGQSGFKKNTNNTFWLKDKNSNRRIQCEKIGSREFNIDGKEQNVPVFEPNRVTFK